MVKLSDDDVFTWIDANIPTATTAKSYKQRIKPYLRDNDDVAKGITDLSILTEIVERSVAPSTLKGVVQVFLKLIKEMPIKISDRALKEWTDTFADANSDMSQVYIQRSQEDKTETFSSIKNKIYKGYPEGSDERLYIDMYELCPTRDDLGSVFIVPNVKDAKDKAYNVKSAVVAVKNYLVISQKRLIINEHKTAQKHGQFTCVIPSAIFKRIDLTKQKLFDHGETLTSWVGKMLKSVGVEGRINTLRHAFLSEKLEGEKVKDPQVRKDLAKSMGHSGSVQLQYLREIER